MTFSGELDLKKITSIDFPEGQYFKQAKKKTQIVLHHSAGWDNARGMFAGWANNPERVATCCGIVDDGTIVQGFSSKFWAWHVNILRNKEAKRNFPRLHEYKNALDIEHRTIGVEVCNWGQLMKDGSGRFHTWASKPGKPITIPENKVVEYAGGWRGANYYEAYTEQEIEQLWKLIRFWNKIYGIPTDQKGNIFEINERALNGTPGVYTHCSYREDKSDMHPQPELLIMLNQL